MRAGRKRLLSAPGRGSHGSQLTIGTWPARASTANVAGSGGAESAHGWNHNTIAGFLSTARSTASSGARLAGAPGVKTPSAIGAGTAVAAGATGWHAASAISSHHGQR